MSARTCVECGLAFDLSRFVPRQNAQYDELPTMAEVWRQPRCRECNKLYHRRRRFFHDTILRLAEMNGVDARSVRRSVLRVIEVKHSAEASRALRTFRKAAGEFNASLPPERSDVHRHGVRVVLAPSEILDAPTQTLLPLKGLST